MLGWKCVLDSGNTKRCVHFNFYSWKDNYLTSLFYLCEADFPWASNHLKHLSDSSTVTFLWIIEIRFIHGRWKTIRGSLNIIIMNVNYYISSASLLCELYTGNANWRYIFYKLQMISSFFGLLPWISRISIYPERGPISLIL